ncbi:hypothetical protein ABL78_7868 [Leptomonas seymouri]|uniref:Uncharacterized protein n=1 Tax=Leptomonas seymouri TaxID=5684 RepID=A0A0N1HRT9_LEPSE|nr:hypothetical protein ABL78_7868 [Leptomonas seymouri]|eukprot:KPI83110.1 hypothetical protein ABL78_7868 [Leptomonas seymouri]
MSSRGAYAGDVESLINRSLRDSVSLVAAEEDTESPLRWRESRLPEIAARLQRTLAEEAASCLVIHDDKHIENLPSIKAPELLPIGRCVSFGTKQTTNGVSTVWYYTGLVSSVTATAVTLLYVNRYTESDFKAYREREKMASSGSVVSDSHGFREGDGNAQALILTGSDVISAGRRSSEIQAGVPHFSCRLSEAFSNTFGVSQHVSVDPRGSLCPAVKMTTGMELQRLSAHRSRTGLEGREGCAERTAVDSSQGVRALTLRTCSASLGPLPCATFSRSNIHDVAYGRSPDRSFYSLFQDPSTKLMDMQYLRMFVRRYLVHTSGGNNPDKVSLSAYLMKAIGCPNICCELVNQLVQEEVVQLMHQDRAIGKERKRLRNRQERREATLREYRAPSGLFANTGFLYLTGLPQGTLLAAVTMLFFTFAFAGCFLLPVIVAGDGLIKTFFKDVNDTFMAALLVWSVASMAMFFHAIVMRVPSLANSPVLIIRGVTSGASAVYAVLCVVLITYCTTNEYLYQTMRDSNRNDLCSFYERNKCSGFLNSCQNYSRSDPLCAPCMPVSYPETLCYSTIVDQLQRIMIPLFLFSIVIFLTAVHSLFVLLKLLLIARSASLTTHV